MGRFYSIPFAGTLTAAGTDVDLLSLQPADDRPVRLRGILFGQTSEIGDAMEEGVRITVRRMTATFTVGSGGAVVAAAAPLASSDEPVWGFVARANDTTVSTTSGTNQILCEIPWNIRNSPYDFWFPDERFCPLARQTEALVVRLETTVADDVVAALTFFVEEC